MPLFAVFAIASAIAVAVVVASAIAAAVRNAKITEIVSDILPFDLRRPTFAELESQFRQHSAFYVFYFALLLNNTAHFLYCAYSAGG